MESVIDVAASAETGAAIFGDADLAPAMRSTLREYFSGFGIADAASLAALVERFVSAARAAGDIARAPALAEQAATDWFVAVFGAELERAELAADIGRLAALKRDRKSVV